MIEETNLRSGNPSLVQLGFDHMAYQSVSQTLQCYNIIDNIIIFFVKNY